MSANERRQHLLAELFSNRHDTCENLARKLNVTTRTIYSDVELLLSLIHIYIEKGKKNPTYETLSRLIERLGISADTLFPSEMPVEDEGLQAFLGKFKSCNKKNQRILLKTLNFLAEQLLSESSD